MTMPSLKEKLVADFFEFDFFQAVRILERIAPKRQPVGLDASPADEVARFRAHLSMSFPPSQIVAFDLPGDQRPNPLLTVTFFGLYGPSGVLPTHYTQLLLDIQRDVRGPERRSLREWLDLFNHRFISLFYRAWEKYRFHLQYERGEAFHREPDTFTLGIRSLMGFGTAGLIHRLGVHADAVDALGMDWTDREGVVPRALARIDDLALLHYAGFFVQRPRNATNLRALLNDYFRMPVEVVQFHGQWLQIPESGQTRLGEVGILGVDAVAGDRVWDVQSRFRVRLGPLRFEQFEELLPDRAPSAERKTFFLVSQMARLFAGSEFDLDIQLVLQAREVPAAQLTDRGGAGPRLGWTIWLISAPPSADADEAVFDAEWVTRL
jgi:type VI secretion system protein ImpH